MSIRNNIEKMKKYKYKFWSINIISGLYSALLVFINALIWVLINKKKIKVKKNVYINLE